MEKNFNFEINRGGIEKWKNESNEILKKNNQSVEVVSKAWHRFLFGFFLIVLLAGIAGGLFYFINDFNGMVRDGMFKSNSTPDVNVTSNTINSYTHQISTPTTNNIFNNYTIINYLNCSK